MSKIIFETKRLYIREFLFEDQTSYSKIIGDYETIKYVLNGKLFLGFKDAKEAIENFIKAYKEYPGYGYWAIIEKSSNELIGDIGLCPLNETGESELGYIIREESRGQGIASEAVKAAILYGFEYLKLNEIVAVCALKNKKSVKLLERAGFVFQKTGIFHDRESLYFKLSKNR